mmetsp:Transcript_18545/g.36385  ORF Transcript_18545/g.36385 Transcript_18545/m.36385 type:complete len:222 (-) Transcript_18545:23-688(-)
MANSISMRHQRAATATRSKGCTAIVATLSVLLFRGLPWICRARQVLFLRGNPSTPLSRPWHTGTAAHSNGGVIDEPVGVGYCSPPIDGVDVASIWESMLLKTGARIVDFLPVTDVQVEARDGMIWRSMRFVGSGPMQGRVLLQHIYVYEGRGEIRFVPVDSDGREAETEVVNALLKEPLRIEYYMRSVASKERVHWSAPLQRTVAAINLTVSIANASCQGC